MALFMAITAFVLLALASVAASIFLMNAVTNQELALMDEEHEAIMAPIRRILESAR